MEEKDYVKQREHFRVHFEMNPLYSELAIEEISGHQVQTGKTWVQVKDISAGGLRFASSLKFPVRDDVLIGFFLTIQNVQLHLTGNVLRCETLTNGAFEYGVRFIFQDPHKQEDLLRLLNRLQFDMRRGCFNYSKKPTAYRIA